MGGHGASFLFCHRTSQNVTQGKRFCGVRKLYLNAKINELRYHVAFISGSYFFQFFIAPISTLI